MERSEQQFRAVTPPGSKEITSGKEGIARPDQAIEETEAKVSYLGVTLEKAEDRDSRFVPSREQYRDYINDKFSLELQKKIAVCFLQGDPPLIEGGTSIGKTTTVRKMCAELGYEVHYVNLNGATDVEDLMGRYIPNSHRTKPEDPEYIFADGKVTSGLRRESGKKKVIILDEINAAASNILIRLHEVLDALERDGEVVLSEDASEAVPTSKEDTKVIALDNPPGKGFIGRDPLDPAQLRRWVYIKEATDLPDETFSYATDALFALAPSIEEMPAESFLLSREQPLSPEQLQEIPGISEVLQKYKEFHKAAKELLKERHIAADQPQPFRFDDRMEPRRVRNFILRFYNGDINETFQQALRYYYSNKLEKTEDREKLEELIANVAYASAGTSKRKSVGSEGVTMAPTESAARVEETSEVVGVKLEGAIKEQVEQAEKILGKDEVFGPVAVEKAFGIKLKSESIPEVPFSKEDLEKAKTLGQFLVLRMDKAADGKPLTMEKMQQLMQPKFDKDKSGKVFSFTTWYKDEDFFKKDTPKLRWALVTKEVVPDSTSKNYLEQTTTLASYLKDQVFKGKTIPKEYKEAIEEFEKKKAKLTKLVDENWEEAAKQLGELKLNQLTRQAPAEVIYDTLIRFQNRADKDRLLESMYTWTNRRSSGGRLVGVGGFGAGGARVGSWGPGGSGGALGVSFSRSL